MKVTAKQHSNAATQYNSTIGISLKDPHHYICSDINIEILLFFLYSPDAEYNAMTSKWPAVWVKISSSWVCLTLYVWTLVAPMILINRDFS